jgi:carboxymethylenebutenolidase
VLGFCLGGKLAYLAACRLPDVACAVGYYGVGIERALDEAANIRGRLVLHVAERDGFCPPEAQARIREALQGRPNIELYVYAGDGPRIRAGRRRALRQGVGADGAPAVDRGIPRRNGPALRLLRAVGQALRIRIRHRDVDATMATMVAEPYVNHIPTMTGGVGYRQLKRFYQHHFVHSNPPDTTLIPLSRTIGASQVVDEMLFCFTHTCEIDWMLPGVPPTGKRVEIPLIAIVKFRGDKLYHEHIYWDQASVLVQIGLLDPRVCRWPASRPRASCWTRPCHPTR